MKSRQKNTDNTAEAGPKKRPHTGDQQSAGIGPRLRHLEKDMARLDEERAKIYDDTYTTLAQYDLKLGETQAILRSRQDNIGKYLEDMKILMETKKEFDAQIKQLSDRHDFLLNKFNQRETSASKEINSLKKKFELIERNKSLRVLLQQSQSNRNHSLVATNGGGPTLDVPSSRGTKNDSCELESTIDDELKSRSDDSNCSIRLDNFIEGTEKNKLGSFVKRLVIHPKRVFNNSRKQQKASNQSDKSNQSGRGSIVRFIHLIGWWCSCKKRPTPNTKQ